MWGIIQTQDGVTKALAAIMRVAPINLTIAATQLGRLAMTVAQSAPPWLDGTYVKGPYSMTKYIPDPPPTQTALTARTRQGKRAIKFWPPIVGNNVAPVVVGYDIAVPAGRGTTPPAEYMTILAKRNPSWDVLGIGVAGVAMHQGPELWRATCNAIVKGHELGSMAGMFSPGFEGEEE